MTPLLDRLLWSVQRTVAHCRDVLADCRAQPAARRPLEAWCDEERVMFNAVPGGELVVDAVLEDAVDVAGIEQQDVAVESADAQNRESAVAGELLIVAESGGASVAQTAGETWQSGLVLSSADPQASAVEASYELVFIDASARDYQQLVDDLLSQSDASRRFEIYLLDPDRDGIEQITEILAGHHDVDAVHLVSHGTEGSVQLGNTWLSQQSLAAYAGQLAAWSGALAPDGDLLFYGCDLAAGESGRQLIESLAALCGCDVAASDDPTGSSLLGGNWELEYRAGSVETGVAFSAQVQQAWQNLLATATFQQGVNSYSSTQDTQLEELSPATSYGANTTLAVDADDGSNNESQGIIRFDNLFGNGAGQIPLGSTINSATLTIHVTNTTDPGTTVALHRMLVDWSESSTWNSLGGGIQTNGVEASSVADSTLQDPSISGARVFSGLAATLQDWANGATNYGWSILSDNDRQFNFASSEHATIAWRPVLSVNYTSPQSPVIDLDANNSSGATGANFTTSFTEDGGAVLIADSDASLTDADSTNLSSLTVTITNLLDGAAESLTANTAGTSITANYNSGAGVLTLSGVDTVANYQQVLRTISYDNTSQNPATTARTITFQASDGSLSSNPATATVNLTAQNDAPVLDLDANNSSGAAGANFTTSFTEDGGAVLIADADAALSDVDNANLNSLTVTITNLLDGAAESLSANTAGTSITANYNSGTGVLTLSGVDTVANYQQVLRTISYNNTSQNPATTARTITFQASDGSLSSNLATATVNLTAQNDAPVLDLDANNSSGAAGANFTTSFTEDGGAVLIADADAALSDVDNANLSSLTVTITNLLDGAAESLTANTAGTGITANYNSGTGVLTLSGVDTVANYQQVLRTISYDNTSQNPTTTARTITFQASDGSLSSNPAAASVNVAAQNNAPVASADNFFVQVGEPFTLTTAALLLNDSDVDSSFLSVEIVGGPLHGTLVINADGSFTYASDPIFLGVDTFSYRLSDGDELSEVTTVTLNVQGTVIFPPSPVTSPATPEPTAEVEDEDPNDQSADEAADEPAISAALLPQVRDALAALPIAGNSPQAAVDSEPVEAEQRQAAPETQSAEADAIGRHFQQHSAGLVGVPRSPEGDGLASLESLALDTGAYWDELNSFRGDLQSQHTFELAVVGSAAVVTTALSVGYVVWTLKGGYLLATAMASTPLWRMVDPLPVLNDLPDNFDVLYDSDESLESLVERNSVASASVEA